MADSIESLSKVMDEIQALDKEKAELRKRYESDLRAIDGRMNDLRHKRRDLTKKIERGE
jgi:hypothetical protein